MVNKRTYKFLKPKLAYILIIVILILPFNNFYVYGASNTEHSYIFDENYHLFGNQLEEDAQYFYLEFLEYLKEPTKKEVKISLKDKNITNISEAINNAFGALFLDFPEYQWLKLGNESSSTSFQTTYVNKVAEKLVLFPVINSDYSGISDIVNEQQKVKETINKIINDMPISYTTRYERLKYIHDYLVKTVAYDTSQTKPKIHSAAGALLNKVSVCEGYAKAFKLACEKIGIPCQLVISNTHMWNNVQMEDGEWYLVDVTFDDPIMNGTSNYKDGKNIKYDYFLKGSKSMKDSEEHVASGSIMIGGAGFTFESLAVNDYDKYNAQAEELHIFKESLIDRFVSSLRNPVFKTASKTIYVNKTYTQSISKLSNKAKISYSSSNKNVGTVSSSGRIMGVGEGSCIITTTVQQGGKTFTHKLKLKVKEPNLDFSKSTTDITLGSMFQFKVKRHGITEGVTWTVDNTSIATIYKGGTLKPLKEGTVIVTASAGGKSIQITVNITK